MAPLIQVLGAVYTQHVQESLVTEGESTVGVHGVETVAEALYEQVEVVGGLREAALQPHVFGDVFVEQESFPDVAGLVGERVQANAVEVLRAAHRLVDTRLLESTPLHQHAP